MRIMQLPADIMQKVLDRIRKTLVQPIPYFHANKPIDRLAIRIGIIFGYRQPDEKRF
jgi:hypothetical protein